MSAIPLINHEEWRQLKDYRFRRSSRLTRPADYQGVFRGKNIRVSNHHWTILAVHSGAQRTESVITEEVEQQPGSRLGLAIAKKRAKRALDRNRQKRIIRESFRHNRHRLEDLDLVVLNKDACTKASSKQLRASLEQLWDKLVAKSNL